MKIVTLPDDHTIEVRGLTRKEIKKLKKNGYHRQRFLPPEDKLKDLDFLDDSVDAAFKVQLSEADILRLEGYPPNVTDKVWLAIINETYGRLKEEKNS